MSLRLWLCFLFHWSVQGITAIGEPTLAICPGSCIAQESFCNNTLDGTNCGPEAKCCLDGAENVREIGFDFSTLPTKSSEWDDNSNSNPEAEVNFEEIPAGFNSESTFASTMQPHIGVDFSTMSSVGAEQAFVPAVCPGACIPKKHVTLCQYIIPYDHLCSADKTCCATKAVAEQMQQQYLVEQESTQDFLPAADECPGECVHPSLSGLCNQVLPQYDCSMGGTCCVQTPSNQAEQERIECTGECLPSQSTYFCIHPFQLVPETINCKRNTVCCMKPDEPVHQVENDFVNADDTEEQLAVAETELAADDNGQLYHVYEDGQVRPVEQITLEDSTSPNFAYYTDVETEIGRVSLYKDALGNVYQLSIIQQPHDFQMHTHLIQSTEYQEATEYQETSEPPEFLMETESSVQQTEQEPLISMPDDSDDMEENMKDVVLPEDGESIVDNEPEVPPAERSMLRPQCPGDCISTFLRFTCTKHAAVYDGFSCPGRDVCCASLEDIEEHELYLKSLSPYFRAAQAVNQQQANCGIRGPGEEVSAEKWCWQVAIINEQNQYTCGGVLIDNSWVITAAHCVTGAVRQEHALFVRAGVTDLTDAADNAVAQTRKAISVFVHHNHNSMSLDNDIALLKLQTPMELTRNVCVVCLPASGEMPQEPQCKVTGYGFASKGGTMSLKMHEAESIIVDDIDCIANVTDALASVFILPSSSFCAGGQSERESCQGDAGGPLVCEDNGIYRLTGLVSWSLGCGRDDVPSIYVKVPSFMGWINQIISASTFLKALS